MSYATKLPAEGESWTRDTLLALYDEAHAKSDDVVSGLTSSMMWAMEAFESASVREDALLAEAKHALSFFERIGGATIADRMNNHAVVGLKTLVEGLEKNEEPVISSMHFDEGRPLEIDIKHWSAKLIGRSLGRSLLKEDGTHWNNMSMNLVDPKTHERLEVTIQRAGKKTPTEVINELRERVAELESATTSLIPNEEK